MDAVVLRRCAGGRSIAEVESGCQSGGLGHE
jgi:hypothetical protein